MTTIETTVATLRDSATKRKGFDGPASAAGMTVGDQICQGDIALVMIDVLPAQITDMKWPDGGQLAPGSTKGSRHCIPEKFRESIALFTVNDDNELSDVCIVASEPFCLVHPEHGDYVDIPRGAYRVYHQQNAKRQRVLD